MGEEANRRKAGSEVEEEDTRIRPDAVSGLSDDGATDTASDSSGSDALAASEPLRPRLKKIAAWAAACVVVLCAVVAGVGYAMGWFGGIDAADQGQTAVEQADSSDENAADVASSEDTGGDDDAVVGVDDAGADDAVEDGESSAEAENSDAGESSDDGGSSASVTESTGSDSSGSSSGSSVSSGGSSTSGSSGSSSGSASGSSSASSGSSSASAGGSTAPSTITVTVRIDSSRAASYGYSSSLGGGTVTVSQGSSVYDALVATGVAVGGSSSYVSSIGGLAEFACGSGSGWLYFVNGTSPGYSCGSYILSGGEAITWVYTCDMGNDL